VKNIENRNIMGIVFDAIELYIRQLVKQGNYQNAFKILEELGIVILS